MIEGRSGWKAEIGAAYVQAEEGVPVLLDAVPGPLREDDSTGPLPSLWELLLFFAPARPRASDCPSRWLSHFLSLVSALPSSQPPLLCSP